MDEINLIQNVLTEQGETGRAAARSRLRQAIAAEQAVGGSAQPGSSGRLGVPAPRWRWALAGAGLTAAAAAVAVVIGVGSQPVPGPAPTPEAAGAATLATPANAREFLLVAAVEVAKEPPTRGRYWHTRWDTYTTLPARIKLVGPSPKPVGEKHMVHVAEQWQAADQAEPSWRSFVRVENGRYRPDVRQADQIGYGAEEEFSPAEVRDLPTDVAALRAVLAGQADAFGSDLAHLTTGGVNGYLFEATVGLLARSPASPAQRSTAYRLLASVPSVELAGTATDRKGRSGLLLRYRGGVRTVDVIIDRETYQVLATSHQNPPRVLDSQTVFTTATWTDQSPPR